MAKVTVETGSGPETEPVTEVSKLLTVVLHFDFASKDNVVVYRYHGSAVDTLTETANGNGEYIELDPDHSTITLYAKNFSTYAIGYNSKDTTSYPITVEASTHGTVSASSETALSGETVTLTVASDSGYYLSALTVLDKDGQKVDHTNAGNNTYNFVQPAGGVTVKATFSAIHHSDPVPSNEPSTTPKPAVTPEPTATAEPTPSATPAPAHTTYSITVPEEAKGGSVTADPKSAAEGASVKLTVKVEDGYHLDSIYVADKDTITLKDNQDGTYTFTMPNGAVTVKATFVECSTLTFPDLDPTAWYHTHTDYVISHGLMNGNEKGLFEPDGTVTRAQMVTLLWNIQNKPQVDFLMAYTDVSSDAWYAKAVRWATSEGIVSGYSADAFAPTDTITREQMATMLYQYNKKYGDDGFTGTWMFRLPFTDLTEISEWAYEGVAWCYMNQAMSGKGTDLFDPQGIATRAEMAAILTAYLTAKTAGDAE